MRRTPLLAVTAAVFALLSAVPVRAQQPETAVVPETITVGDVFHAAVRLALPNDVELLAPDSLELPEDVEAAGARQLRVDTAGGASRVTVLYPMAAWRPGSYELPRIALQLRTPQGLRRLQVRLPGFAVRSVLPEDTTGIQMKAAKDVLGANRLWWPWLLLALLLLLAVLAYLWWRRRRRVEEPVIVTPPVPAREVALARLAALRRSGMLERGEFKPFYAELSETMRHYAATVTAAWSVDLTTTELAHQIRRHDATLLDLIRVLGTADLVKFARARPSAETGFRDVDAAESWVERTSTPEPVPAGAETTEPRRVA
jgi:hypothetical protein